MATIRELFVKLGVDADNKGLQEFDKGLDKAKDGMIMLTKVTAVAAAAFTGFYVAMSKVASRNDDIAKTSRALGFATDQLQKWQYAAGLGGVKAGEFSASMRRFSRAVYDAGVNGLETYKKEFDRLGISLKDGDGKLKETGHILLEMSDKFAGMKDGIEKTAVASVLFGRSGAKMINVFNSGTTELKKQFQELRDMGGVATPEQLKMAEDYVDAQWRMSNAIDGITNTLFKEYAPAMIKGLAVVKAWIVQFKKLYVDTGKLQKVLKTVAKVALFVGAAFASWAVGSMIYGVTTMIFGLITAIRTLGFAALIANSKLLLIPLLLGAGFLAWSAMFKDLYKTITNPEAHTVFSTWRSDIMAAIEALEKLKNLIKHGKLLTDKKYDALPGQDKEPVKMTGINWSPFGQYHNSVVDSFKNSSLGRMFRPDTTAMNYNAFGAPQNTVNNNGNKTVIINAPNADSQKVIDLTKQQLEAQGN